MDDCDDGKPNGHAVTEKRLSATIMLMVTSESRMSIVLIHHVVWLGMQHVCGVSCVCAEALLWCVGVGRGACVTRL